MKTSQQLAELRFHLQSQQLFLTHLALRFNKLLGLLEPMLPYLRRQQSQLSQVESTEAEYLSLLNEARSELEVTRSELTLAHEQLEQSKSNLSLYEQELEGLLQIHREHNQRDTILSNEARDIGKSLARVTSERNALNYEFKALESAYQDLKKSHDMSLTSLEIKQKPLSHGFLTRLQYQIACETAQAIGSPLSREQKNTLSETLGIPAFHQKTLDSEPKGLITQALKNTVSLGPVKTDPPLSPWVVIPRGSYTLGDDMHPAERPCHEVIVNAFSLARTPVTNADFADFMAAGGYENQSFWTELGWHYRLEQGLSQPAFWGEPTYCSGFDFPLYPVVGVSWYEAMAYARWAKARLPNEPEWEAAARGLAAFTWPWGDTWRPDCANTAEAGHLKTTPVGLFPEGATPEGVLDLIGNVFEWTASVYGPYPYSEEPFGDSDLSLRGCSFNHKGNYFSRSAYRFHSPAATRHSDIGFRLARSLT